MPDLPIPDVEGMLDHVPDLLRVLMVVGLLLLLVILRFDAERFNAAEYDDIDRWGRKPSLLRRLAWYTLGIGGVLLVLKIHPDPSGQLYLSLGDRLGTVILGLAYGAIGAAIAVGIALYRYHYVRFPPARLYPAKITNAIATAFLDEAIFRGILFGFLLGTGMDPNAANLIQAIVYALATRLGAPGRPWYMLGTSLLIGLAGGWLTATTGGIGAAFLGHSITRIAIFLTTGHAGIPKARGTEDEEVERRRRTPEGWRVLDFERDTGTLTVHVRPPVALYVHVPFCISLCPYCDFVVYAGAAARGRESRLDAFMGALLAEITLRADAADAAFGREREPLRSVYLGGGTPTLLPSHALAALLDLVRSRFGIAEGAEVTVESNPGPDERGSSAALAAAGVTRLSIGAQAFDAGLLRRLGRRHRPEHVAAAVREARDAGIRSVSVDLLYDVPGQSLDAWAASLDAAIALGVDHVSAYALTLDDPDAEGLTGPLGDHLPTTVGARRWRAAAVEGQDDDRAAAQYRLAVDRLGAAGFRGYEISNWARPGHESRHNLAYWRREPYEAVGPGAHAFDGSTRRWNAARLDGYLAALAPAAVGASEPAPGGASEVAPAGGPQAALPPGGSEIVDAEGASVEAVILGLRLDEGLARDVAERGPLAPHLAWAVNSGLLEAVDAPAGERLRLTTEGRLLSNELFARLV